MLCRAMWRLLPSPGELGKHELEKAQETSAAVSLVWKGLPLSDTLAPHIIPFLHFVQKKGLPPSL